MRYQRIADFGGPDDELHSQARRIINAETSEWDAWECERAGWVLVEAARQLRWSVPPSETRAYARRAWELGARAGSGPLQVRGHLVEAGIEVHLGEFDAARERYELTRRIARDILDRTGEADALRGLGHVEIERANPQAAGPAYREALWRFERLNNLAGQLHARQGLGNAAMMTGNLEDARVEFVAALGLCRRLSDDAELLVDCLTSLALVEARTGRHTTAASHYQEALELHHATPRRVSGVKAFHFGVVALKLGDYDDARDHFTFALRDATARRDPSLELGARQALARLGAGRQRQTDADEKGGGA